MPRSPHRPQSIEPPPLTLVARWDYLAPHVEISSQNELMWKGWYVVQTPEDFDVARVVWSPPLVLSMN